MNSSSTRRRSLTFKISSVSGLIPGGQSLENNSSIVIVGSVGIGLGTGNTSYIIMWVKGSLWFTNSWRKEMEEIYYLGCGSHSASARSAVWDLQRCPNFILFIRPTELYEDHNPNLTSRPFMPETTVINRFGFRARPIQLQDNRREVAPQSFGLTREKCIVWLLHTASISSSELSDSCSGSLVLLFYEVE